MISKKLLTKHVWFDGMRWEVKHIFQPNKHDDYLLLARDSETLCHDDGTIPVDAVLVDCHNDEFYPDSQKIRKVMAEVNKERRVHEATRKQYASDLTEAWLAFFKDHK